VCRLQDYDDPEILPQAQEAGRAGAENDQDREYELPVFGILAAQPMPCLPGGEVMKMLLICGLCYGLIVISLVAWVMSGMKLASEADDKAGRE
jgi:hypothetical protein